MASDVKSYVKNCESCNKNKSGKNKIEPLVITDTPATAFDIVQIDTVGPLPRSFNGNEYALTIICDLSKFLITVAIPSKAANIVAKAIVENCILVHGPIKRILTDMGTEYKNQLFEEICKLLKIENKTSTPYHHQTLGTVERSHRTFNEYIRSYISINKLDWDHWLKYFTYCYNTTPSTTHGYTPFELVYGKTTTPYNFTLNGKVDPIYNIDDYKSELKFKLQTAQKRATDLLEKAKVKTKENYDKKQIHKVF